jgi:hypothetical protein
MHKPGGAPSGRMLYEKFLRDHAQPLPQASPAHSSLCGGHDGIVIDHASVKLAGKGIVARTGGAL